MENPTYRVAQITGLYIFGPGNGSLSAVNVVFVDVVVLLGVVTRFSKY